MKKFVVVLLCLIIIISLFSCTVKNTNDTDLSDNNATEANTTTSSGNNIDGKQLSAEQAWNLANEYWDNQNGRKDYAAGTVFTAKVVLIDTPNSNTNYYRFAFQVEWTSNVCEDDESKVPYHVDSHDEILVNAFNGEVVASTYDPYGKILSVEEAIEIAKNHRSYMSGDMCNEENGYRVEHAPNVQAPEHVYVIVIQKYDTVTDRLWIDKNTGKTISPYYMYGKG